MLGRNRLRGVHGRLAALAVTSLVCAPSLADNEPPAQLPQMAESLAETPDPAHPPPAHPPPTLRPYQVHLVRQWFRQVGERRPDESFGELVARTGEWQVGKPYGGVFKNGEDEQLRVNLSRFECVSFVETTLAVARCVWKAEPDEVCFAREVLASRYRDGELIDYASRLHYATDWIEDNAKRARVMDLTEVLGGTVIEQQFDFMSQNVSTFDGLEDPAQLEQIRAVEARLSAQAHVVLDKSDVAATQPSLQTGDLIAVVSNKLPGLMIGHVGFIDRWMGGKPRFLHASSYHSRVVLTTESIANYAVRQSHRRGILVIRPLPPPVPDPAPDLVL